MVDVQCEHCGMIGEVPETVLGKRGRCRECGQHFTLRAMEVPTAELTPRVPVRPPPRAQIEEVQFVEEVEDVRPVIEARRKRPPPQMTVPVKPGVLDGLLNAAAVLAGFCWVALALTWCAVVTNPEPGNYRAYSGRFEHENAWGTSANATEYLAKSLPSKATLYFIAGIGCGLFVLLNQIRRAIDRNTAEICKRNQSDE